MRTILTAILIATSLLGGCASLASLRDPLPQPDGPKRQLNKGLWDWEGRRSGLDGSPVSPATG